MRFIRPAAEIADQLDQAINGIVAKLVAAKNADPDTAVLIKRAVTEGAAEALRIVLDNTVND